MEPEDAIGIPEFLAHARSVLPRHALVPGRPTFTSPGAELRRFDGAELGVSSVKMLTDGRRALAGSGDGLRVWDLDTGAELRHFGSGFISEAAVLADGRRALSGSFDQTLSLWDLETGTELRRFEGHQGGVNCVAAVPSAQQAVSRSADQPVSSCAASTPMRSLASRCCPTGDARFQALTIERFDCGIWKPAPDRYSKLPAEDVDALVAYVQTLK